MQISEKILLTFNDDFRQKLSAIGEKRNITKQTKLIRAIIDQVYEEEIVGGHDRSSESRQVETSSEVSSTPANSVNLIIRPRHNRMVEITRNPGSGRIFIRDVEKPPEERDQKQQQAKKSLNQHDEDEDEENGEENHEDEEDEDEEEDQPRYISKILKKS